MRLPLRLTMLAALLTVPAWADSPPSQERQWTSIRLELETMLETDQSERSRWQEIEKQHGPESVEFRQLSVRQEEIDRRNQRRLAEIVEKHGWPRQSAVGPTAANAAFLIVQHSHPEYMRRFLPLLREAVAAQEADPASLAYLEDRILTEQGKKQVYGTQLKRRGDGTFTALPIEDETRVDERRASIGLGPLGEYIANFGRRHDADAQSLETLEATDRALRGAGKLAEAAAVQRKLVEKVRQSDDGRTPQLGAYVMRLAQTLNALGQYAEAEPLAREGLKIRERHYTPGTWHIGSGRSTLGKSLFGQGRMDEAEPHLLEGYRILKSDEKNMPMEFRRRIRDAAQHLVEFYQAKGDAARVKEFTHAVDDHDAFYGTAK